MSSRPDRPSAASTQTLWLPFVLLLLTLVMRGFKSTDAGASWMPNFSPWMALAFTGTLLLPRTLPWWTGIAALLGLDLALHGSRLAAFPATTAMVFGCALLAAFWAWRLRDRVGGLQILGGVLACGLGFYLVTNTATWFGTAAYAKTLSGWVQAQTIGLPGYPPTWVFLRNSLISDLGFSVILLLAHQLEASRRHLPRLSLIWGRTSAAA